MPRFLSFVMFIFLKLIIVVTQHIHSMVLDLCYTIENLFQLNYSFIDNIPTETFNDTGFVPTQTSLDGIFPGYIHRKSTNTDILVYNLGSSRKITIKHKTLKKNFNSYNCSPFEILESEVETLNDIDLQTDNEDINNGETFNVTNSNSAQHVNLSSSNMSIEKHTTNSQIVFNSPMVFPDSKVRSEEIINTSTQCEVEENEENMTPRQTSVDYPKEKILQRQTSSPICHWSKLPAANQRAEFDIAFHSHQNVIQSDEIPTQISVNEFRSSDQFNKSTSVLENTVLLDDNVKQRLSLSPNTKNSASKAAALSLKSIQDEIIEYTRNTPRYEMNKKEIKFPYTPEISNLLQTVDDKEEAKEIFSCSSYESLPVSDHIRTAFEKNILSSLYTANIANITEPDFSSVDSLVEAFRKLESTISVCKPATNLISESNVPNKNCKKTFTRNFSAEFLEMDKRQNRHNMRKAVSSGILYSSSSYQHSFEKDKFARDLTELESQNCNQDLVPVNSDFKSITSSLSSVLDDKISENEVKESEYKSEKSDHGCDNTLDENTKINFCAETNLATGNVYLSGQNKTCENNSRMLESSEPVLNIKTQNIQDHNQENEVLIGKSAQKVNIKYLTEPAVTESFKLISNKQERTDTRFKYARKSFTGCRNKIRQKSNPFLSSTSPNHNVNTRLSEGDCKSEHFKTCSVATNIDTPKELQESEKIENKECSKVDESLLNTEKSTNSSDLDDIQNIQSIMNNDIDDKYKFTFIEDETLRTPESKGKADKIDENHSESSM